jgi:hypothetical protein
MDWKQYEAITKYIYETLGKDYGVKIMCHGGNCKVRGKSGVSHQIDVLTSHSDGIHTYKTAIECKYWDRHIDKEVIMKVAEIVEDAGLNKGVIVSKLGFTSDATDYARYRNIGLIELREMQTKDWENRPHIVLLKSERLHPEITRLVLTPTNETQVLDAMEAQPKEIEITLHNGEKHRMTYFLDLFVMELKKQPTWFHFSLTFLVPNARISYLKHDRTDSIKAISIGGVVMSLPGLQFRPVDQIWLIMKDVFEGTTHTITEKGVIRKDADRPAT